MLYFGFLEQVPHGEIYRRNMGGGKIRIEDHCRWRDKGIWESLLEEVITEPDYEWLMIDASYIKVHPHGTGAVGGNQAMNRTKGAQFKDTFGRGFAWYAGPILCYRRYSGRL